MVADGATSGQRDSTPSSGGAPLSEGAIRICGAMEEQRVEVCGGSLYEGEYQVRSGAAVFRALDRITAGRATHFWTRFEEFCRERGVSALPASTDTLLDFIVEVHSRGEGIKLPMFMGAVTRTHRIFELPPPTGSFRVRKLWRRFFRQERERIVAP